MGMPVRLKRVYQVLRYGAVSQPLPDYASMRIVELYVNGTSCKVGEYDRQTQETRFFEECGLTEGEREQLKSNAQTTQAAAVVIPSLRYMRTMQGEK